MLYVICYMLYKKNIQLHDPNLKRKLPIFL